MKAEKMENLSNYLDLIDKIEKNIQHDMDVAKDAIQELAKDQEEILQKVNDPSFKNLTKEAQQAHKDLYKSIGITSKVIGNFSKDEKMQGEFSNTLVLECCDLLEKLVNDKSTLLYVSSEDTKEYRRIEERLEGFLKNRKFYLENGFIAYQNYKLAKIESKQKDSSEALQQLDEQREEINQKRQKVLDYLRKQEAGELSREEGRELLHLRREISQFDTKMKRFESRDEIYDEWIDLVEQETKIYEDEIDEIDDFLDFNASSI